MQGKFEHFFPGANTSRGFYSLFHYILPQEFAKRIICIKGGPGTGKSYLMKKLVNILMKKDIILNIIIVLPIAIL